MMKPTETDEPNKAGTYLRVKRKSVISLNEHIEARQVERALETTRNFHKNGKLELAESFCKAALETHPGHRSLLLELAQINLEKGYPQTAKPLIEKVIRDSPYDSDAYSCLGHIFLAIPKYATAHKTFQQALTLNPSDLSARIGLGRCYFKMNQLNDALKQFELGLLEQPHSIEINRQMALVYQAQGRYKQARTCIENALQLDPNNGILLTLLLDLEAHDPTQGSSDFASLAAAIEHASLPRHLKMRRNSHFSKSSRLMAAGGPIRIGYLFKAPNSPEERRILRGILCSHDHHQFTVHYYSTAAIHGDRDCIFRDINRRSDELILNFIENDQLDILIELDGHQPGSYIRLLRHRSAPVQLSFGGPTGLVQMKTVDYLISDRYHLPTNRPTAALPTIPLPQGLRIYIPPKNSPPINPLPALKQGQITFGYMGELATINGIQLRTWNTLLERVPKSRLCIQSPAFDCPETSKLFKRAALRRGIDPKRLILRGSRPETQLLLDHHEIDIALDTFPMSNPQAARRALWMGVPVVTQIDERYWSRHTLSYLGPLGLERLVTHSAHDYIDCAVELAENIEDLAQLRSALRYWMRASDTTSARRFVDQLENALRSCWNRWNREENAA